MEKLIQEIENKVLNNVLALLPPVKGLDIRKFFEVCNANGVSTKTILKILAEAVEGGVFNEN